MILTAMRVFDFLTCALVVLSTSCWDDGSGSNGSGGSNPGGTGGDSSTGGTGATGTGGGLGSGATGGGDTASHDAACRAFCTQFKEVCDKECGETCSGHVNTYGQFCANEAMALFECLQAATDYDCDAGTFRTTSDSCGQENEDVLTCKELGGAKCERDDRDDPACSSEDPLRPYGFYCVSSAVPQNCQHLEYSTYCCPTE